MMYPLSLFKIFTECLFFCLLLIALCARADMAVIDADGPVFSIQPYLSSLGLQPQAISLSGFTFKKPATSEIIAFPIKSSRLSAGQVEAKKVYYPELLQPLFLVGSDAMSQRWLSRYEKRLQTLQAVGFLVQAGSKSDWQQLQQLAGTLPLIPVDGDGFAERFGLQHYPVLISSRVIEQ